MREVCEVSKEAAKKEERRKSFENVEATTDTEGRKKKGSQDPRGVEFADLLLENPHLKRPRRWADILLSLAGQVAFVIILLLIPLYYTHGLDLPKFEKTMLISPPPPPPPPPSNAVRVKTMQKPTLFDNNKLIAPRVIPKQVEMVKEQAPPASSALQGVAGGVPGGVPGGTLGGVLGGVLSSGSTPVPPPRKLAANKPLRVGGQIQAPRLVRNVQPLYPELAKETHTQGAVVLDCVIDTQGNVTQMKLISGHPLLVGAAMQAVRQWKYQPTLLNGTPVAVEMMVHVNFSLGGY
jgi:periplasmic protein TonB